MIENRTFKIYVSEETQMKYFEICACEWITNKLLRDFVQVD